ncbi:hypothetical protein JIN85_09215 [Luteolibacter pohnpeiensis]|uniref:Prepilin-type N-terminal cleavage/methylation domain-containing protein n=2 Tax=Luteolibacter pohnpeiensis TaxID=454153 RepID=A0A934SB01_9BACT|nr:hypothetical protein [Luteolibacter pohnpeiensis]
MRATRTSRDSQPGLTLLELTVVLLVLLTLMATGFYVTSEVKNWRAGREAGETLRTVYTAQRMYLADHPTEPVTDLTMTKLLDYLPNKVLDSDGNIIPPTVKSLKNTNLTIVVNESPPYLEDGGVRYDQNDNYTDGVWDVGE